MIGTELLIPLCSRLVLHNPITLRLDESSLTDNEGLTQYVVKCEELDKYAILAALFQLKLIKGLCLLELLIRAYLAVMLIHSFGVVHSFIQSSPIR